MRKLAQAFAWNFAFCFPFGVCRAYPVTLTEKEDTNGTIATTTHS